MTVVWIVVAVAVLAAAGLIFRVIRRSGGRDLLSELVASALAAEWGQRLGVDAETVRSAVLRGEPARVRDQLATLIAGVTVDFEISAPSAVSATVTCTYAGGGSATTSALRLPWERVPAQVREQHLRTGQQLIQCGWSISLAQSAAS